MSLVKVKLFKPSIILEIGDYLREVDNTSKGTYRIYRIMKIENNSMSMEILFDFREGKRTIYLGIPTVRADITAHHYLKGDRYRTYYLGSKNVYSILYAN